VSAEWTHVSLIGETAGPDADFDAAYIQAGYFLTGEHKGYRLSSHAFDRTKIYEPFFRVRTCDGICCGKGAWELKVRWSYINCDDGAVIGGEVEDFSAGVNWYLNNYTRVMFDYIHSISRSQPRVVPGVSVPGADGGEADLFGIRAQVDW
jgi:phosphate-selective porin OprO/OprP